MASPPGSTSAARLLALAPEEWGAEGADGPSMQPLDHERVVAAQFGPNAKAYFESAVHARGEDLDRLPAFVRGLGRVLDLGCGGGHVSFTIAPYVREVTAYDLSDAMLEAVRDAAAQRGLGNIVTRSGRAELLPFKDGTFDAIVTRFSAHHWSDVPRALGEARRVLHRGGKLRVIDVVAPGKPLLDTYLQAIEVLRDPSHVRDYSLGEWSAMLRAAGFSTDAAERHRLQLEFAPWIERMRTPPERATAIRSLQAAAPAEVTNAFEFDRESGDFGVDVVTLTASA